MSILTKDFLAATPGSPGVPGYEIPGVPPTSPKPAYCVDVVVPGTPTYDYIIIRDPDDGSIVILPVPGPPGNTVVHTCYPATPGSPGTPGSYVPGAPPVPASPADYQVGWNASARSIESLTGDGQYQFTISPDAVGIVTGFNDADVGSAYMDIDHAMYFASGSYDIIENGVKLGVTGTFIATDEFTIARIGTVVRYFKNTTLLYTSLLPSSGEIFADASMYFGEDEITDAALTGTVGSSFTGNTGSLTGVFFGLLGIFSDSDGANTPPGLPVDSTTVDEDGDWPGRSGDQLRMLTSSFISDGSLTGDMVAVLPGMTCFIAETDVAEMPMVFTPLTAVFVGDGGLHMLLGELTPMTAEMVASDVSASMSGRLTGLSTYMEVGLMTPDFAAIDLTFQTMTTFQLALAGMSAQLTGVLGGLRGFASNAPNDGAYIIPGVPLPVYDGNTVTDPHTGDWEGRSGDQLRMMVGLLLDQEAFETSLTFARGMVILPMLTVDGNISSGNRASGAITLPQLTTYADFGYRGDVLLPSLTADAGALIDNVVRAEITLPMLIGYGTGVVGTVWGTSEGYPVTLPALTSYGQIVTEGEGAAIALPMLEVAGRAFTDLMLDGAIRLPRLRAGGLILTPWSVDPQNPLGRVLQGHLVLPALQGARTAYGAVLLPLLTVAGYVPSLAAGPAGDARMGYAMNLKNAAVTEFTNFPFLAMARAYGRYWGVGLNGKLYRMGGDLDDTDAIDWEWLSGQADFGVWGQKATLAVYIRGIFESGATVTFVSDDATRVYEHVFAGDYNNYKVHRVSLGRGVRTDSMAFGMANLLGGYLELDKVTPEYRITPRNL